METVDVVMTVIGVGGKFGGGGIQSLRWFARRGRQRGERGHLNG